MKAVRVVDEIKEFVVREIERPAMPTGAVRVKIEAAFLPPYFEHLPEGSWRTPPRPFTAGQCAIGTVLETTQGDSPFRPRQLVYCDMYIQGSGSEADHGFIGCFGLTPAASRHLAVWPNGTFAEEFVGPEQCFTPIPDGVTAPPEILCRIGWFGTALAAFQRGGFKPGMTVAINGAAGLLGASAMLVALAIGASQVRLIGRRTNLLHELAGLDRRIVVEEAGDKTPIDFVLDCSGGEDVAKTETLAERLRRFGALTFVGALTRRASFDTSALMRNSNSLVGSFWFPHAVAAEVLSLIASGALDLSKIRAECFGIENIKTAMEYSVQKSGGLLHVALKP
ncbi:hypothetical protein [Rhizobium sp. NXC24]|uniref:alcohol dehydrogenase catalytic domain-containing protein n=1 Tax=Rhizobium sp. NXC24 TaxID=2048897 RepID=UPI000CDF49C9|nr:hypothetical protein [Rhizobium sp. NXC24]AVA21320.1 Zn-dependent alcohol dehydrogenase GroES-like protein [Rhizobium sp. NXC24]